jgi:hypothetical protein
MSIARDDLDFKARTIVIVTGTSDGIVSGACRVFGMGSSHTAAANLQINNNTTVAGGGTTVTLNSTTNLGNQFDFGKTGIRFDTGLSAVQSAGNGWVSYIAE